MAIREILVEGDPALLKKSRQVVKFDDRLATLVADLKDTMYEGEGVGLAAPQVGVLRRLFVMDINDGEGAFVFINPEIIDEEGEQKGLEGCLSLPGLVGIVSRPLTVKIRAQDETGEYFEKTYSGLAARCVCHETDHLDGVLYRQRSEIALCTIEEFEEKEEREREEREKQLSTGQEVSASGEGNIEQEEPEYAQSSDSSTDAQRQDIEKDHSSEMKVKYAFMGTPDFATIVLDHLESAGFLPSLVVTQPDRPSGRGRKLTPPPVAVWAKERNIPLIQPLNCKEQALLEALRELQPEVILTASFGQYIPHSILTLPEKGCVNVHASLLPKYRGASPIQAAIKAGDKETGVTLMLMDKGFDTGPMLAKASLEIAEDINAGDLSEALAHLGGELLARELPRYLAGETVPEPQDESMASETHILKKSDGCIDFSRSAREVHDHIRAMSPWPGAFTFLDGKRYKLLRSRVHDGDGDLCGKPGEIQVRGDRMFISCAEGVIELIDIQPQSRPAMCVDQCAHNFECGALFQDKEE